MAPDSPQAKFLPLIQRWRDGYSKQALAALLEETRPLIIGYLCKKYPHLLRQEDLQSDLTSETLLKIARNLTTYDESKATYVTWVCLIAQRATIDYFRKVAPNLKPDEWWTFQPAPSSSAFMTDTHIDTVQSYVIFKLPPEALVAIGDVFLARKGTPDKTAVVEVQAILDKYQVKWNRYAPITALTGFLFGLIRLAHVQDDDLERLETALSSAPRMSPVGLMTFLCGRRATAQLLLLFGGSTLALPSVQEFTALVRRGRPRKKR